VEKISPLNTYKGSKEKNAKHGKTIDKLIAV
jgi:hypothetical protein